MAKKKAKKKAASNRNDPAVDRSATVAEQLRENIGVGIEAMRVIVDADEIWSIVARANRKVYMAHIEAGFSNEEALKLTMLMADNVTKEVGNFSRYGRWM